MTGKFTVNDRRVFLTKWVGQAWRELHAENQSLIQQTFCKLNLSLAVDDSEDQDINIKDLPDIMISDWAHKDLPEPLVEEAPHDPASILDTSSGDEAEEEDLGVEYDVSIEID